MSCSFVHSLAPLKLVDDQAAAELRLKPGSLGRHNHSAVRYAHYLLHGNGVQRQSRFHLAAVHALFQFAEATQPAHEIQPLRCAEILYAQYLVEYQA